MTPGGRSKKRRRHFKISKEPWHQPQQTCYLTLINFPLVCRWEKDDSKRLTDSHFWTLEKASGLFFKCLDPLAVGWPACIPVIAATALLLKETDKLTMGQVLALSTTHSIEVLLHRVTDDQHGSPTIRFLLYISLGLGFTSCSNTFSIPTAWANVCHTNTCPVDNQTWGTCPIERGHI